MGIARWPAFAGMCVVLGAPVPAFAQEEIDTIVVTARKREESLQDVPLSVAAFSSSDLQGKGLQSDYDIANFTVGFRTLAQTGRDTDRPTIRGMSAPVSRGEPNASYFIDGTFVSGSISTATTSSVERVEVLRGPQSAQFGRATFAGAINYVTRKPSETFEGQINTRAGTHDDYNLGGWISGPIIEDKLLYVLSANWSHYGGQWKNHLEEGQAVFDSDPRYPLRVFLSNPPTEGDHSRLGVEETTDILGKLVWRPREGSEVSLKYGFTKGDDSHFPSAQLTDLNCYVPVPGTEDEPWYNTSTGWYCGRVREGGHVDRLNLPDFRNGVTYILANTFENPDDYKAPPAEPGQRREQNRVLLEYIQDFSGFTLTTRGSWNKDDFNTVFDLDHSQTRALWGLFHFDLHREIEDWSGEMRLDTPADLPVRAALGVYVYEQDRSSTQRSYLGPAVVLGFGETTTAFPTPTYTDVTNRAVYGSVEWDFAEQWTLTVEARYAEDSKDLSGGGLGRVATGLDTGTPNKASLDFDSFTPRATMRFRPNDDLTLYALVAKGNKPGDFNVEFFRSDIASVAINSALSGCVPPANPSQDPEIIPCENTPLALVKEEEQWTMELGAKATMLDGRLTANLALYHIDWDNQGLFTLASILQTTDNYLRTTILRNAGKSEVDGIELETSFRATDWLSLTANYGYTNSYYESGTDAALEEVTGDGNIKGKKSPNVPKHTVILGGFATHQIGPGVDAFLNLDYAINSKRYTQPTNLSWVGHEETVNLRAGIELEKWTITGYVRNLTNDRTPITTLDFVNFGTIDVNYPVNEYGNLLNDLDPRMFSISPKRGRDWGVEVQYRF